MNYLEEAAPSIGMGRIVDHERLPLDILYRNKAPESTVMAEISVISHHEQMPRRYRHRILVIPGIHVTGIDLIAIKVSVRVLNFLAVQDDGFVPNF